MCERCPEETFKIDVPALVSGWLKGTEFGMAVVHGYAWAPDDPEAPTPDEAKVYELLHAADDGRGGDVTVRLTMSQLKHLRDAALACVEIHNATESLDDAETAQRDAATATVAQVHRIILGEVGEKIKEPKNSAVLFELIGHTTREWISGESIDINTGEVDDCHALYVMRDNTWVHQHWTIYDKNFVTTSRTFRRVPDGFAQDWLEFNRVVSRDKKYAHDMTASTESKTEREPVMAVDVPGAFVQFLEGTSIVQGDEGETPLYVAFQEAERITRGRGYSLRLTFAVADAQDVLGDLRMYADSCIDCNQDQMREPGIRSEVAAARRVAERCNALVKQAAERT